MQKVAKIIQLKPFVVVFICSLILMSCSHNNLKNTTTALGEELPPPVTKIYLGLKSELGNIDKINLFSKTITQNISTDQLLHQKEESVDFTVLQKTLRVDKNIHMSQTTTAKEGVGNLRDMAYPELNETINFILNTKGEVLKAGSFPKDSLFYIAPLPLPDKELSIGDTWAYQAQWLSEYTNAPMTIEIAFVLKKILKCFSSELCAGIAWNGKVLPLSNQTQMQTPIIESKLQGYAILRVKTGTQVWSYIKNSEILKTDDVNLKVYSCMKSVLDNPEVKKEKPNCDPIKDEFSFEF